MILVVFLSQYFEILSQSTIFPNLPPKRQISHHPNVRSFVAIVWPTSRLSSAPRLLDLSKVITLKWHRRRVCWRLKAHFMLFFSEDPRQLNKKQETIELTAMDRKDRTALHFTHLENGKNQWILRSSPKKHWDAPIHPTPVNLPMRHRFRVTHWAVSRAQRSAVRNCNAAKTVKKKVSSFLFPGWYWML